MGIGTKVDVDFSQLGIAWQPGKQYRIGLQAGFVKEDGGEEQPSPANSNLFTFTTNATGPVVSNTVPISSATNVIGTSKLVINYNRKVIKNSGTIRLYKVATPDVLVQTFNITDSGVVLTNNDQTVEIDIYPSISEALTTYYFLIDEGIVKDSDNFLSPSVANANTIRFTSGTAPSVITLSPVDNSTDVNTRYLTMTFDRAMALGTGYIKLYFSNGQLAQQFDVETSDRITISGGDLEQVNIDLLFLLESSSNYYVLIDNGALKDAGGLPYAGITSTTAWNFTTGGSATASGLDLPGFWNETQMRITYPNGTLPTPTADAIAFNKGIKLYEKGTVDVLVHTFYHGKTAGAGADNQLGVEAAVSNNFIYFYPRTYLDPNKEYYVLIDAGAYYDDATNLLLPSVADTTTLAFNTDPEFLPVVGAWNSTIEYTGNQEQVLFPSTGAGNDYYAKLLDTTSTYTVEISSPNGKIGYDVGDSTTLKTLTGTRDDLRPLIEGITFFPNANFTSSTTVSLAFKLSSALLGTQTLNMQWNGTTIPLAYSLANTIENPNPNGISTNDYFGGAVAVSPNYVLVGAYGEDNSTTNTLEGKAYLYSATSGTALQTFSITGNTSFLGKSVAVTDNYAAIGAEEFDTGRGRVDVYNPSTGSLINTYTNPLNQIYSNFGYSIAISANKMAVGIPNATVNGFANKGAVYVYDLTTGSQLFNLTGPTSAINQGFGFNVSFSTDYLVVRETGNGVSKVHVYSSSGTFLYTLERQRTDVNFTSISSTNSYIALGAPTPSPTAKGYVSLHNINDGSLITTIESPTEGVNDFGSVVAVTGEFVVVNYTSDNGPSVYNLNGTLSYKLSASGLPSTPNAVKLAAVDDRIVVGDSNYNSYSGRAYLFKP